VAKPFFYRIDAASFMAEMMAIKSDKERGIFAKQLSIDLVTGIGTTSYAKMLITETVEYIDKKKRAGKKGGEQKASSAKAVLEQKASITLASSSNSNSNNNNTETENLTSTPSTRMTINDFRFVFTDSFKTSMPPGCNNLASEICQRETREAIIGAFQIAAEQGKCSLAYVNGVLLGNGKKKTGGAEMTPEFKAWFEGGNDAT
jgi:DNA replication protein DnaD